MYKFFYEQSYIINSRNESEIQIIITTMAFSTDYTITACKTLVQSVYFSNQVTRTQMLDRICRISQP